MDDTNNKKSPSTALDVRHFKSLVLISGISGGGKSTASKVISDLGFFAIDNLPVPLLPEFIDLSRNNDRFLKTCLLLDIDSSKKLERLMELLAHLRPFPANMKMIFLDSSTEAITRRYSETRRPHPGFDPKRDKTLADAVQRERNRLLPLKEISHVVFDTTSFTIHDLKRELREFVDSCFSEHAATSLRVNFLSFGFKRGLPLDCDLVVDVRFLPNPHFVDEFRDKTGLDKDVSDFVLKISETQQFLTKYSELINFLLPQYSFEGKAYVNIGVGCTGGQHRSVAIAEELAKRISSKESLISVKHRDLAAESS